MLWLVYVTFTTCAKDDMGVPVRSEGEGVQGMCAQMATGSFLMGVKMGIAENIA